MDSRLAMKRRSPGALPCLLSKLSRVRPPKPAARLLPVENCFWCIHQFESSSCSMRRNRILRRLLSCRRAGFSCEQLGLKRIYGKPTSPDKASSTGHRGSPGLAVPVGADALGGWRLKSCADFAGNVHQECAESCPATIISGLEFLHLRRGAVPGLGPFQPYALRSAGRRGSCSAPRCAAKIGAVGNEHFVACYPLAFSERLAANLRFMTGDGRATRSRRRRAKRSVD
jgi:hypothetical protein